MKRNLVGKILGKIKIFVQDLVPIRTALYDPRVFFKKIFLVLYAAYFVVRGEGMGWGGKTLMEE